MKKYDNFNGLEDLINTGYGSVLLEELNKLEVKVTKLLQEGSFGLAFEKLNSFMRKEKGFALYLIEYARLNRKYKNLSLKQMIGVFDSVEFFNEKLTIKCGLLNLLSVMILELEGYFLIDGDSI